MAPDGAVPAEEEAPVATGGQTGDATRDEAALAADTESEAVQFSLEESQAAVEALLYASGNPLSLRELKKALPEAGEHLRAAIVRLEEDYARAGRGLQIVEVAGGWQITTRPEFHELVGRLVEGPKPARISIQALETLAVIAYRQPVTVPEIMELRGVRSAGVVRTLLEKKLVKIMGRRNVVGRPLLYGTTKEFLLRFGLKDVKDLPQLKDMSEVFGDEVSSQLDVLEAMDAAAPTSEDGEDEAAPEPEQGDSPEDGDTPEDEETSVE